MVQFPSVQTITQLFAALTKRVTSGVLAENKARSEYTDGLWSHNFVGQRMLNHAILMNSGLMCKGVTSNDRLVRLHGKADDFTQQLAGRKEVLRNHTSVIRIAIRADAHGHH